MRGPDKEANIPRWDEGQGVMISGLGLEGWESVARWRWREWSSRRRAEALSRKAWEGTCTAPGERALGR